MKARRFFRFSTLAAVLFGFAFVAISTATLLAESPNGQESAQKADVDEPADQLSIAPPEPGDANAILVRIALKDDFPYGTALTSERILEWAHSGGAIGLCRELERFGQVDLLYNVSQPNDLKNARTFSFSSQRMPHEFPARMSDDKNHENPIQTSLSRPNFELAVYDTRDPGPDNPQYQADVLVTDVPRLRSGDRIGVEFRQSSSFFIPMGENLAIAAKYFVREADDRWEYWTVCYVE